MSRNKQLSFLNVSEVSRKWLKMIQKSYSFDPGEAELLEKCAQLKDTADAAIAQVEIDGSFIGVKKTPHPGIRVHRQSIDLMAKILKQLGISTARGNGNEKD